MAEDIFLPGKFTDLTNPHQLAVLNDLIYEMLGRLNQIDTGSIVLAWIQGAAAGQVIASKGVGNSPEWDASPTLTNLTLSGLTASQLVSTNGSKQLVSTSPTTYQATSAKDAANGYAGLSASSRTTKGIDTTDDIIIDLSTKGLVLKDTQAIPHYWRVTVNNSGALVISDVGTTKP